MKSGAHQSWRSRLCTASERATSAAEDSNKENLLNAQAADGKASAGRAREVAAARQVNAASFIKEGFLNSFTFGATDESRNADPTTAGRWLQVFLALAEERLSIFPNQALAKDVALSIVPGTVDSAKSKPFVILPDRLIAVFSDHFQQPPLTAGATQKSVSPDPVPPPNTGLFQRHLSGSLPHHGPQNSSQHATKQVPREGRWGRTVMGLLYYPSADGSGSIASPQMIFLTATEGGLLLQWIRTLEQWVRRRTGAASTTMWLPMSAMLPSSPDAPPAAFTSVLVPQAVWDVLFPGQTKVDISATSLEEEQNSPPAKKCSQTLGSLKIRSSKSKSRSSDCASIAAAGLSARRANSKGERSTKQPSLTPPLRKKLIALKETAKKMNERLSSHVASRTTSNANSLRCSTIHKSDTEVDHFCDSNASFSSLCEAPDANVRQPTADASTEANLDAPLDAGDSRVRLLEEKLSTLSTQNIALEAMNARLSGRVLELENRVDLAEMERDEWIAKHDELISLRM